MEERLEKYITQFVQLNIDHESKLDALNANLDTQFEGRMKAFDRRLGKHSEDIAEQLCKDDSKKERWQGEVSLHVSELHQEYELLEKKRIQDRVHDLAQLKRVLDENHRIKSSLHA